MPLVFEHAAFTVRDGHEQALLDERPASPRARTSAQACS
jgi:hypothetical protein